MEEFKYLIPEESIEAIVTNVSELRKIEQSLRKIFEQYKYQEVLMPSFEYVDLYTSVDSGFEVDKMFQYINNEGKNVTMRTDFTIPLARLYANSKLTTARFSYFGKVYRKQLKHKGRSSELYQGGIELINEDVEIGNKEILNILEDSLKHLKIKNILVELGSATFFNRVCELVGEYREELTSILVYKQISEMKKFVSKTNFDENLNKLLLELPTLFGGIDVIDQTLEYIQDEQLIASLKQLKTNYSYFNRNDNIKFDLAMVPMMKYYTGLMFKGYSDKQSTVIISGGRYDRLLPKFNKEVSAIGFTYHLDEIIKDIVLEGESND